MSSSSRFLLILHLCHIICSSVSVPHLILQQSRDLPTTSSLGLVGNYYGAVELASPTRLVRLARLVLEVEDRGGVDDLGRHGLSEPWREFLVFAFKKQQSDRC